VERVSSGEDDAYDVEFCRRAACLLYYKAKAIIVSSTQTCPEVTFTSPSSLLESDALHDISYRFLVSVACLVLFPNSTNTAYKTPAN